MNLSLTGARWNPIEVPPARLQQVIQQTGLSNIAARCFAIRWDDTVADKSFLSPNLEHLCDPLLMKGMDEAVARLEQALQRGEHVRIITDYDVDGTTSSLILQAALKLLSKDIRVDHHIPNRFDEGYGFSTSAAKAAVNDGVNLIVTADIGVRDHAAVTMATQGGTDVLICDHHLPAGASVPPEAITLCPPQLGCQYPNPHLAACGVSLKLATALLASHPRWPQIQLSLLKLAAIGTVADLVPLTSPENRAIVSIGLTQLNRGPHHAGLRALLKVCNLTKTPIDEYHLGYRIGPRINAAGRIADAKLVVRLLNSRDPVLSRELATQLDRLNTHRRDIQQRVVNEARTKIAQVEPFLLVSGHEEEGWHRGVVGIVASKIKEE
ncbi:MAG: single-stranded-DNA-specific exonuclease RecJ, partial [Proteobacteria bacterium]|nr:single-stranded-DNA-specific exonuclease RecJ [Pseudomonadota bacterium]